MTVVILLKTVIVYRGPELGTIIPKMESGLPMAIRKEQWMARNDVLETDAVVTSDREVVEERPPTPEIIRSLNEKATTRTRQQWLDSYPDGERILVQCDECQEKLRALSWITDDPHGFGYFQPIYEECSDHPELFARWIADVTRNMNFLHQRQ